MNKKYKT